VTGSLHRLNFAIAVELDGLESYFSAISDATILTSVVVGELGFARFKSIDNARIMMCIPSKAHDTNPEPTSRIRAVSLAGSERARGFDRSYDITAIDKLHSDKTKTSRGFTNQATESIWVISGQNLDE
jgi:hypothetical protein